MTGPIVFDGGILGVGPITGVGRAFLYTLAAYAGIADRELVVLLPPGVPANLLAPGVTAVRTPAVVGALRRQRLLPGVLDELRAALLHSPVTAIPLRARCPTIATVHDVPWRSPSRLLEPGTTWWQRFALGLSARRATRIIVPSRTTAADLDAFVPRHAPIEVVPHGVPGPTRIDLEQRARGPFLTLGDDRPRKNLARLREAHELARQRCPTLPDLRHLGPGFDYVDEATKLAALRQSTALCQVSLHEGFGLPVIEAFAHGVPVVCSDRGALAELAGDAAITCDPEDVESIATALVRIHEDRELRSRAITRGRARAAEFSIDRAALAWLRIHRDLDA